MAEDIRWQLLADFEPDPFPWRAGFDLSKVRALADAVKRESELWDARIRSGRATVAESRRAQGLEVRPGDDIYLRQANLVEVPADGGTVKPYATKPAPAATTI
jgi:hypothetical protein